MTVASRSAIQSAESEKFAGLIVSLNGLEISRPYLSTIEIENNGTKPVTSSDFESPIEISVQSGVHIARARVSKTEPETLAPHVTVEPQVIKVSPLLLNPGDRLVISVLTSGAEPQFNAEARIVNLSRISIIEGGERSGINKPTLILIYLIAVSLTASALVCFLALEKPYGYAIRRRTMYFMGASSVIASSTILLVIKTAYELPLLGYLGLAITIALISAPVGLLINRPKK